MKQRTREPQCVNAVPVPFQRGAYRCRIGSISWAAFLAMLVSLTLAVEAQTPDSTGNPPEPYSSTSTPASSTFLQPILRTLGSPSDR